MFLILASRALLVKVFFPIISFLRRIGFPSKSLESLFWKIFWWVEYQEEARVLGVLGETPIRGSERAVLIEKLVEVALSLKTSRPSFHEVGMGYGQNLFILSTLFSEDLVSGSDISEERVVATRELLSSENKSAVRVDQVDIGALGLDDSSVDIVFASAVFLYLDRKAAVAAVRQMNRVSMSAIVFLEQHQEELPDIEFPSGIDGGRYYIRDYREIFAEAGVLGEIEEYTIPNPRWGIERWAETARVFVIKKVL